MGINGQGQAPTYCATKGAITSFSKGLAIDEAANGFGVGSALLGSSVEVSTGHIPSERPMSSYILNTLQKYAEFTLFF